MAGIEDVPLWMLSPERYMRPGEAAQALGMTLRQFDAWVADGPIEMFLTDTDKRLYSRAEVAVVYELRAARRDRTDGAVS